MKFTLGDSVQVNFKSSSFKANVTGHKVIDDVNYYTLDYKGFPANWLWKEDYLS